MLNALKAFVVQRKNGLLISSGWAHCQAERQDTWFPGNSQFRKDKVGMITGNTLLLLISKYHDYSIQKKKYIYIMISYNIVSNRFCFDLKACAIAKIKHLMFVSCCLIFLKTAGYCCRCWRLVF